jgi:hypothetical protein
VNNQTFAIAAFVFFSYHKNSKEVQQNKHSWFLFNKFCYLLHLVFNWIGFVCFFSSSILQERYFIFLLFFLVFFFSCFVIFGVLRSGFIGIPSFVVFSMENICGVLCFDQILIFFIWVFSLLLFGF